MFYGCCADELIVDSEKERSSGDSRGTERRGACVDNMLQNESERKERVYVIV